MAVNSVLQKIAKAAYSLGDHNDPLNVVLAIALFKGINRPLFTMMDKKSDPEVKKYAAFREGLTEIIAATTYILTNKILVNPLTNTLTKLSKNGSPGKIKNAMEFFCVCLSAAVLIPAACNLVLNPIMKGASKLFGNKKQTDKNLDIKENVVEETVKQPIAPTVPSEKGPNSLLRVLQNKYTPYQNGNMKVGV